MAYVQIRDESAGDTDDEKEGFSTWIQRDESRLFSYRNLFGVTLTLWLATLASLLWVMLSRPEPFRNHTGTSVPFPTVPSRVVVFNPDTRFHYTATDTGASAWATLIPEGGGIISINEPHQHRLPPSFKDRNNSHAEVYSMSMYHQLHCLDAIRISLGTQYGFINVTGAGTHHKKRMVHGSESHADHCIDYLRQAIMCTGDISLEHSIVREEFGFNGWGAAHQCADWDAMRNIALEMQYVQGTKQEET